MRKKVILDFALKAVIPQFLCMHYETNAKKAQCNAF